MTINTDLLNNCSQESVKEKSSRQVNISVQLAAELSAVLREAAGLRALQLHSYINYHEEGKLSSIDIIRQEVNAIDTCWCSAADSSSDEESTGDRPELFSNRPGSRFSFSSQPGLSSS